MFLINRLLLFRSTAIAKVKPPLFPRLGKRHRKFHLRDFDTDFWLRNGNTLVGNQKWIMRKEHKMHETGASTDEHFVLKIGGTGTQNPGPRKWHSYGLGSDTDDSVVPWLIFHRFVYDNIEDFSREDCFEVIARESQDAKVIRVTTSVATDDGDYVEDKDRRIEMTNLEQKTEVKKLIHEFAAKEEMTAAEFVDALPEEFRDFAKKIVE